MELVFCFVLLFLLKIRYPSGLPITAIIHNKFGRRVLVEYRRLEKVHFRIQKLKLDLDFLHLCKAYDVAPKFLHFKIYDKDFRNTTLYRNWQQTLLEREIRSQEFKLDRLKIEYRDCDNIFRNSVSFLDYYYFLCKIKLHTLNSCKKVKEIHERKLSNLGIRSVVYNKNCIFNYF